jgi:hypothetical protein
MIHELKTAEFSLCLVHLKMDQHESTVKINIFVKLIFITYFQNWFIYLFYF